MIYSVWNPLRHVYTYHRGPDLPYGDVPAPKHLQQRELGTPADSAAWPLPSGAQEIGEGLEAKGMIATGDTPDIDSGTGWLVLLGVAVAFYGASKILS